MATRKEIALAFLAAAKAGRSQAELVAYMAPGARHHNAYFPAGMDALTAAMIEAHQQQPESTLDVQRAVAEGDLVAVHSRYRPEPNHPGYAVTHWFRFEGDKIAEMWDFGQPVPEDLPNTDGLF